MTELDPTCIGRVRHVLGATVTVALDPDLAGVAPIYRGRLQPIGQIGSIVRLPQGLVSLIGTVTLVGIAELAGAVPPTETVQLGDRWLRIQLLGEIDGLGEFSRGIGTYPGLDDPVHFATAGDLKTVFPPPSPERLRVGQLAAAPDVPVCLDANRLVMRHAAIVGSTGSGKTSAVASLLQGILKGGWPSANVVVIDPHGEYGRAVGNAASVRSVLSQGDGALRVPYWALPADQILQAFAGSPVGGGAATRFAELVAEARKDFVDKATWLNLDQAAVTSDTPVPFDINTVWLRLDYENNATLRDRADPDSVCEETPGDAGALQSATFTKYGPAGKPPHKSATYEAFGRAPDLLRLGLGDPRLEFFRGPCGTPEGPDPLAEVMVEWLGGVKPVSVLDFSGVPTGVADLAIGVVINLIFEAALRSRTEGIGRPRPVLLVLEEAHRYLGDETSALTRESANRIAREGRKYGIGLIMVTQRPSELPDTALAQCGTIISLRLTNSRDQGGIRASLPDAVSGLAEVLPSLRTGEAVISGEAVVLPVRALIDLPDPQPDAQDPSLEPWRATPPTVPNLKPALDAWRGTYDT